MASKKRGGRDDFGFNDDLDFDIPEFGGDDPLATANDRKPIATGLKSAASGFGKTFTNEARLRKTITKSLPREYEEPISKAFEIKDGVRDLYNSTSSQTQEIVRETKRSVGRIARNLEPVLPKKLADRLKSFGDSADNGSSRGPSKDEVEQNTINGAFAEIFAQTQQAEAENETKRNARQIIQSRIDQKRHHDTTSILGSIDQALIKLSTFQEKEGVNYMKKSLELQFRTYFIQSDMLKLQSTFFEQFRSDLQAITKNTGLPDFVKKAPKEALLEHLRSQTFDAIGKTITSRRNEWLQGAFKKAGAKATETLGRVREGASMILDTAESASGMYGSGMGPSKSELVGDIAGGYAGNKAQDYLAGKVKGFAKNHKGIVKGGNRASQIAASMPQWVNNQVQNGKFSSLIPDWVRDIVALDGESGGVHLNREVDMERAAQFSDKNSRTLNSVIPELLAKIHQELYVTRTGDDKSGPLQYDYEKGKFVTKKERRDSLLNSLVSKRDVEQNQSSIEGIFAQIDPKNTLDKETRNKIAENIYKANKNGAYFDRESMSSYNVLGDQHDKAGDLVRQFIESDSTGANERRLSRDFSRLGANQVEMKEHVQALINSGRHGELADLGLINLETGRINLDAVRKLELGTGVQQELQEFLKSATPAAGGLGAAVIATENQGLPNERSEAFRNSSVFKKQGGFIRLGGGKKKKTANEGPGAFQAAVEQFNAANNDLKEVRGSGKATNECCDAIEKAIQEASGKTELEEIRDILKRIEANGITGGGQMTPEMFEAYMSNRPGFFGKAGMMASKFSKGLWNSGMKSIKTSTDITKGLFNKAKSFGSWGLTALSKQKDKFDLFIEGEVEPRLKKARLEAGKYMDATTGKIIEKYEDIKGDIKDIETGEIVLYGSEVKNSILKNLESGKAKLGKMTDWGKSIIKTGFNSAKKSIGMVIGGARSAYGMAWKALGAAYEALTDGPMDVYLKDQYDTPALSKRLMSKGLYFDKETLDPITKVSDIKGAVVDNDNDVRISKEDLQNGLYDKNGKEIKTGFDRVKQFAGDSIKKAIGSYRKFIGKAKEMGGKAMAWMKGLFGFDSPLTIFSRQTNDILSAIYNLLNDRMPGERSPDLEAAISSGSSGGSGGAGVVGKVGAAASAGWDKLKEKATAAKDKLDGVSLDAFNEQRKKVYDKMGRPLDPTLDKIEEMVEILKDRLPEAKDKVFGDLDGDGVREGSFDDLRKKRDALKEKAAGTAATAKEKLGAGAASGYAKIADMLKSKKDEEGDGEKDGDTYVDLGDGDGKDDKKDKKGKKNKKPRGKIGRGWDKLKDKLTPKGKGLGARALRGGGRFLAGAAKFGGRLALGGLGLLAGGGGLSAGILTGGLSAIGSVLGMTVSAIGAIIASPITVPALALAGVGLAGYGLYKWLSNPDPKPLEKVRLVQYGWKSNDTDAYKKMKSLEEALKSSVSFKGETAEIDKDKVDIGKLMEIYGLDKTNQDHAKKFVDWFANRFRPIFLQHQALIKTTGSTKPLEDVDSNKPELKKQYLDQCLFPGGHYSVSTSPNKDQESLYTNQYTVETEITAAKLVVDKEGSANPSGKQFAENGGGAATGLMKVKAAQQKKDLAAEEKKAKEATVGVPQSNTAVRDLDQSVADQRLKASTLGTVASAAAGAGATMAKPGEGGPPTPGGADYKDVGAASAAKASSVSRGNVPAPTTEQAQKVKAILIRDMPKFGINTPNQQAALLGNIEHESNFKPISENMNYKAARLMQVWPNRFKTMEYANQIASQGPPGIANVVYGGRMGNTEPNDGWDYRGRGPIQITGKNNYAAIDKIIGKGIVKDPDKVLTDPQVSAETAMAYWKMNPSLGKNADAGNFQKVRQIVNGGNIGMDDALSRTARYLDLIKNNQLPVGGANSETGNAYDNSNKAGTGTGEAGTLVASPKPTQPNTTASLGTNPNVGPVPVSYQEPAKPVTPAQVVSSPRPSVSNTTLSTAAVQSAPVSSVKDNFYKSQSDANRGDSMKIMNESLAEYREHTGLLRRIAEGIDSLPTAIVAAMTSTAPAQAAPSEANNYNKPAAPVKPTSVAFRRSLAGT